MSENRISRNGGRFDQDDFVVNNSEDTKNCQNLSEPSQESFYNISGIDESYNSPLIHYSSSGSCKDLVKITSTTTNCVSKAKK